MFTAQEPLLTVQRRVVLAPIVKPVNPDEAEEGVVIVAEPAITLQLPTPVTAAVAPNVATVILHRF